MKVVKTILAVIGALAVLFAGYHAVKGPIMHRYFGFDRMEKQLNLTAEQKKQIKDHRQQHKTTMQNIMKQSLDKRRELMKEIQKTETNQSKISLLLNELNALEAKINREMISGILEMKKVLTMEQFEKMNKMMLKKFEKGGKDIKNHARMDECGSTPMPGPDKATPPLQK